MTDVVRCQQEPAGAPCIFDSDYVNTRRVTEEQFHEKRCRTIGDRMKELSHLSTIAQPFKAGKAIEPSKSVPLGTTEFFRPCRDFDSLSPLDPALKRCATVTPNFQN